MGKSSVLLKQCNSYLHWKLRTIQVQTDVNNSQTFCNQRTLLMRSKPRPPEMSSELSMESMRSRNPIRSELLPVCDTHRIFSQYIARQLQTAYKLQTVLKYCNNEDQINCKVNKRAPVYPRPTQPSIPPGSVNEYQLRLGRQRQVWFIPLADVRGACR